jgi:hypothetical protein
MPNTIINKVTNCPTIAWNIIKSWEFNQLKDNSNRDIKKLKQSIISNGFIAPFDAWKSKDGKVFIIDGTGRNMALLQLETEGVDIPDLPVLFINAKDLKEAKKFALQRSSQHGKITNQSLADFTANDFDLEELEELKIEELNLSELDFMIENLEEIVDQDFSNKNKEIEANSLGNESSLVFKYTHQEYMNILDLLNNAKEKLECDTNEQTLIKLLSDYE